MKRFALSTMSVILGLSLMAPNAFAAKTSSTTDANLVALGDSITFGYNLGDNKAPSPLAFPFLIGADTHQTVEDLGVPGWTSEDLLQAMNTEKFQTAVKSASIVTVDIGSNDLLHAASRLLKAALAGQKVQVTAADSVKFETALLHVATDLPKILHAIRLDTKAPIVLFNLYDPFADSNPLHAITETMIKPANQIIDLIAAQNHCVLVNAYAAFDGKQLTLIRPLDVHPTAAGQQVLAMVAEQAMLHAGIPVAGTNDHITLNGQAVADPAVRIVTVGNQSVVYSSAAVFASQYGVSMQYDTSTNTLRIDGQVVASTEGKLMSDQGQVLAPTVAMANAVAAAIGGGTVVSAFDQASLTENITVLPVGYEKVGGPVSQVGQAWANKTSDWPLGPVYLTAEGRLIGIEYLLSFNDFHVNHDSITVMPDHLPVPAIDHVQVAAALLGDSVSSTPHADLRLWFIDAATVRTIV